MNRWWILGPALGAAVALHWFGEALPSQASIVASVDRHRAATPGSTAQGVTSKASNGLIPREQLYAASRSKAQARDLFEGRDWTPPPTPAATVPTVVVDEAPPFPYVYAGRKQEADATEIYLMRGDFAQVAKAGQTLEGTYLVEAITATDFTVVYLPTGRKYTISTGTVD